MDENEILAKRREGKFVIKAEGPLKTVGNPFRTPFPLTRSTSTFAVLDSYVPSDLPQLKKFAAERLSCSEKEVVIEVFKPIKM